MQRCLGLTLSLTAAAGLAAAAVAAPRPGAPQRIEFAPHRAVYDVSLERSTPGSGVAFLTGRMVYELTGNACEGYTQNYRYVTVSTDQEGTSQTGDLRSTSWEDGKGSRMRFNTNQYQDYKLFQSTAGTAERKGGSGPITVELTKPEKQELSFAPPVYFPMQHSAALIAAARAGKSFFSADIYDGSEKGIKISTTTAVIGHRSAPGAVEAPSKIDAAGKLAAVPSWPVSIGFFEPNTEQIDAVPTAEQSYRFYANGVSTDLVSDFGDYTLRFELTSLEFLDASPCTAK